MHGFLSLEVDLVSTGWQCRGPQNFVSQFSGKSLMPGF